MLLPPIGSFELGLGRLDDTLAQTTRAGMCPVLDFQIVGFLELFQSTHHDIKVTRYKSALCGCCCLYHECLEAAQSWMRPPLSYMYANIFFVGLLTQSFC